MNSADEGFVLIHFESAQNEHDVAQSQQHFVVLRLAIEVNFEFIFLPLNVFDGQILCVPLKMERQPLRHQSRTRVPCARW